MVAQLPGWKISSGAVKHTITQTCAVGTGVLILVIGFRKFAALELSEARLRLGIGVLFSVFFQCLIISCLVALKRKRS